MIFDLIAQQSASGGTSAWTPANLFLNGEIGFWFDSSDLSTMFQDSVGATPVTAAGQRVGLWKNKIPSMPVNYDLKQASTSLTPILRQVASNFAIEYDGVDDQLASVSTSSISAVNGITMSIGQRISTNVAASMCGLGGTAINNNGSGMFGSALSRSVSNTTPISLTSGNVYVVYGGAGTAVTLRTNGIAATGTVPAATTESGVLRVTTEAISCSISQYVMVNRLLTPSEITLLETFIASKQ